MHTSLLSHDLQTEFPDLAERVQTLRTASTNFARLFDQHREVDAQIVKAEKGVSPLDDFSLEELKKRRLKLKDELYQMLKAG